MNRSNVIKSQQKETSRDDPTDRHDIALTTGSMISVSLGFLLPRNPLSSFSVACVLGALMFCTFFELILKQYLQV